MTGYIKAGGTWQELSGTDRPYVKVSGSWQGVSNGYVKVSGSWQQAYQYDNTGPTVPTPTSAASGNDYTASWGAITDSGSGVASATLYQKFYGSSTGWVSGSSYSLTSGELAGGSHTFSVPTTRRHQQGGETWWVYHYITAYDNASNSTTSSDSTAALTRPYGSFTFVPSDADSWNGSAWTNLGTSDEGVVRYSTTWNSGAWFYGTSIYDDCKSFAADSGTIWVQRAGASQTFRGNSGTFYLRACDRQSASGAPSFSGTQASVALSGNDATALVTIPSDWLTNFANGTAYGAGLVNHSAQPGYLRGLTVSSNNNAFNIYSGTIFLTFN